MIPLKIITSMFTSIERLWIWRIYEDNMKPLKDFLFWFFAVFDVWRGFHRGIVRYFFDSLRILRFWLVSSKGMIRWESLRWTDSSWVMLWDHCQLLMFSKYFCRYLFRKLIINHFMILMTLYDSIHLGYW